MSIENTPVPIIEKKPDHVVKAEELKRLLDEHITKFFEDNRIAASEIFGVSILCSVASVDPLSKQAHIIDDYRAAGREDLVLVTAQMLLERGPMLVHYGLEHSQSVPRAEARKDLN